MDTQVSGYGISSPLDDAPMLRGQFVVLALALALSALEGYDVLSMAFVAPAISHEWAIDKSALGFLLSSGLLGMAAGGLGLTPFADMVGRRPVLLAGVALIGISSLLSAFTYSVAALACCRVITGLGVGVMISLVTALAAEFANARQRPLAVATMAIGLPLGGVFGGLIAASLVQHHLWRYVFLIGAAGSLTLMPLVLVSLPESPSFLVARRPPNALARLNRILHRLGHPPVVALPPGPVARRVSYKALFAPGMAAATVRLTLINILIGTAAYFVLSWLPQMITDAGFPSSTAIRISVGASVVGMVASVLLGALARVTGPARLAAVGMLALGVSLVAFGFAPPVLPLIMASAVACGISLSGSTGVFYATLATAFTPLMRVSGIGFVSGSSRLFSALGPYLAGWLFHSGLSRGEVSSVFAAGAGIGGLILALSPARQDLPAQPMVGSSTAAVLQEGH